MKLLRASLRRHRLLLSFGVATILLANGLTLLYPYYLGKRSTPSPADRKGAYVMSPPPCVSGAGAGCYQAFTVGTFAVAMLVALTGLAFAVVEVRAPDAPEGGAPSELSFWRAGPRPGPAGAAGHGPP